MPKRGKKSQVPKTKPLTWAEQQSLRKENAELKGVLTTIAFRTTFFRDVLGEAGKRLSSRGRLTKSVAEVLRVQVMTVEQIMVSAFGLPSNKIAEFRAKRDPKKFDEAVETTCDEIAPVIIHPSGVTGYSGMKGGKIIIH